MISAWEIYLVMQADNFKTFFVWLVTILVFIGVILAINKEDVSPLKKYVFIVIPLIGLTYLIPSSKTLAAMIIVPKLASQEIIGPVSEEFKELYQLAKDGLKKLVVDDEKKMGKEE